MAKNVCHSGEQGKKKTPKTKVLLAKFKSSVTNTMKNGKDKVKLVCTTGLVL